MRLFELNAKLDLFQREVRDLERIKKRVSCLTCEHGSTAGYCSKFNATPPEDVQRAGCEEWFYDAIPF